MKLFTNDIETVIAADLADARLVWHEQRGGDVEDFDEEAEEAPWREMEDGEMLAISCDEDGDPTDDTDAVPTTKTAAEWAKRGREYLCSTEF